MRMKGTLNDCEAALVKWWCGGGGGGGGIGGRGSEIALVVWRRMWR